MILLKIINAFMVVAFALSAFVQYNDPDPVQWIAIYTSAFMACLGFWLIPGRQKTMLILYSLIAILAFIWMIALLPSIISSDLPLSWGAVFGSTAMKNIRVELVREAGGLGIVVFWMVVLTTNWVRQF